MAKSSSETLQPADTEWIAFPGGELEGRRPKALCPACREPSVRPPASSLGQAAKPLCFQCYRAELQRDRALKAAGQLDTASEVRFQSALPFEPVNTARLAALKAERAVERARFTTAAGRAGQTPAQRHADRRRQAQISARHALQAIGHGLRLRPLPERPLERSLMTISSAAELQLPESWLPFVLSR
jgi:hypothetical protein